MGVVPSENVYQKKRKKTPWSFSSLPLATHSGVLVCGTRSGNEEALGKLAEDFSPKVRLHRALSTNHRREQGPCGRPAVTSDLCPCGRVVTSPQRVVSYNAATGDQPVSREGVAIVHVLHNCSSEKEEKLFCFHFFNVYFSILLWV